MVQLVRGSLIESLYSGLNPLEILGKGLGPHMMSSHNPLGPGIRGSGYRWFEDSSWQMGILGQGFKPLMGLSHMSSHSPLRPRIPGKLALKTIQLAKGQDTWDWIV